MTVRQRTALVLLVSAGALGIAADVLFEGRPLGLNALLFGIGFVAALSLLLRVGRVPLHQGRRLMVAPLLLFSGLLAWHDSPLLVAADLLAVAGAVSLGALRRTAPRVMTAELSDYAVGAASAGAAAFAGAIELMERDIPWKELGKEARSRHVAAVARGVAIGLPLLILFGALFATADAVFANLLTAVVPDTSRLWLHLAIVAGVAWLSAGLLRDLLAAREEERLAAPAFAIVPARRYRIGSTEITVALAAVNVLFVAFVLVQLRYLFGGRGLVESRLDLTYAQYARHGFFELVAVAVLVLPLLLFANWAVRKNERGRQAVRLCSATLVGLVLVVIASALERMWLYEQTYGLTELRIYATGVILWLACVFLWLGATVLRSRPRAFASGAVLAGFVATIALNALNPDALIARTNLSRPHVDAAYVAGLSDDAIPTLLARLPSLQPRLRAEIAARLLLRSEPRGGLLAWNLGRLRAQAALTHDQDALLAYAREPSGR